ncbi:hypothetical protein EPUL_000630, partial [Erysiphe pulchra]
MAYPSSLVPKWANDLKNPPTPNHNSNLIQDPPNFISHSSKKNQNLTSNTVRPLPKAAEMDVLKLKKAWEVALAPVKQLPMTAFMMYMSGNTMQIFSIMMVVMAFKTPFMGLLAINQAFGKFESDGIKS